MPYPQKRETPCFPTIYGDEGTEGPKIGTILVRLWQGLGHNGAREGAPMKLA